MTARFPLVCLLVWLLPAGGVSAQRAAHWAFVAPTRPLPPSAGEGWARNDIDRFVAARQRAAGVAPSPPADPALLIRRACLDLVGVPPTVGEVDAFVAAADDRAYGDLVQRLINQPGYGEQMALRWLDLARYGDTHGFHVDSGREMWHWRDWVVAAFQRNMRFDRFTIEQLAGDLLPDAGVGQLVASGFNRNHMINVEGGADPAEYAVRYVTDRVNTTSATWLGLTVGCAECHDHKYDPISQREYYALYALFNNVPEKGLDGHTGNAAPTLEVPSEELRARLLAEQRAILAAFAAVDAMGPQLDAAQREWESSLLAGGDGTDVRDGLAAWFALDDVTADQVADLARPGRFAAVIGSQPVQAVAGRIGGALQFDGRGTHLRAPASGAAFERDQPFTLAAFVDPRAGGVVVGRWLEGSSRGWALTVAHGEVSLQLSHRGPRDAARIIAKGELAPGFNHVAATHDGSGKAAGMALYVNGHRVAATVEADALSGAIENDQPLRIGGHDTEGGFDGVLDDVRVYDRLLSGSEIGRVGLRFVVEILRQPGPRTAAQAAAVRDHFRRHVSPLSREAYAAIRPRQAELMAQVRAIPTTMVMRELPAPRPTHLLIRGDYRRPGEVVAPGVPAVLPPLPVGATPDRLAFARWLVAGTNPLTARVFVNRLWEKFFGVGLVRTSADFGTRGEAPSHPELLDWLADEFVRSGWDVAHMVTLIVTSATYRQASVGVGPAADQDLRLLSGIRRVRLWAETVRDNALAIGGILDRRVGGPGVRPVQPDGLWEEVAYGAGYSAQTYEVSPVADRYRRGLYVYVKRSAPYASMRAFDVPTREVCTVHRDATTTPAQALVLLNDPVFVEAARALAARMLETARDDDARLAHGFRRCVARPPNASELEILRETLRRARQRYRADRLAARALLGVGDVPVPAGDPAEVAAFATVASVLLNKSETITRP